MKKAIPYSKFDMEIKQLTDNLEKKTCGKNHFGSTSGVVPKVKGAGKIYCCQYQQNIFWRL